MDPHNPTENETAATPADTLQQPQNAAMHQPDPPGGPEQQPPAPPGSPVAPEPPTAPNVPAHDVAQVTDAMERMDVDPGAPDGRNRLGTASPSQSEIVTYRTSPSLASEEEMRDVHAEDTGGLAGTHSANPFWV